MKISVIIPVFNAALFLDKAIQSVLPLPQVGEILLIDDRSEDDSYEICKQWADRDHRIQVFRNKGVKGAGATRNIGIRNAKFDFVAFLDADDYFLEGRFADDSRFFERYRDAEAISYPIKFINEDGNNYEELNASFVHGQVVGPGVSEYEIDLWSTNAQKLQIPITGVTFRKSVFEKVGYFDEQLKQCQDTNLILRMLISCKVITGNHQKPVAVYYRHGQNTTRNLTEAVFYRRLAAKKHFALALSYKLPYIRKWKYFKDFMEYDFLWIFGRDYWAKSVIKLLMLPIFLFRINSGSDPVFDKNRYIRLS